MTIYEVGTIYDDFDGDSLSYTKLFSTQAAAVEYAKNFGVKMHILKGGKVFESMSMSEYDLGDFVIQERTVYQNAQDVIL